MHKVISAPKLLFNIFLFLTVIIGIVQYILWFWIAPPFAGEYNTYAYFTGVVLLTLYGLTIIFWICAKNIVLKGPMLVLSALLLLANAAYINWFKPTLVASITCNGTTYFVTFHSDYWFYDRNYYQITKRHDLHYKEIFWTPNIRSTKMICNEKENEIEALNSTYLLFSDKTDIFNSESVTYFDQGFETTLNNLSYSLYSYDSLNKSMEGLYFYDPSESKNGVRKYLLSICDPDKPETCKYVSIDHSSPTAQNEVGNVIADLGTGEIYILFDSKIYFIYEHEPRRFDLLVSNWIYSIVGYTRDSDYVYVLYKCYREYGLECGYIPFSYTTTGRKDAKLNLDVFNSNSYILDSHKLSVYIDEKLVFTYKVVLNGNECRYGCPESRCLVAGCTTPGQ